MANERRAIDAIKRGNFDELRSIIENETKKVEIDCLILTVCDYQRYDYLKYLVTKEQKRKSNLVSKVLFALDITGLKGSYEIGLWLQNTARILTFPKADMRLASVKFGDLETYKLHEPVQSDLGFAIEREHKHIVSWLIEEKKMIPSLGHGRFLSDTMSQFMNDNYTVKPSDIRKIADVQRSLICKFVEIDQDSLGIVLGYVCDDFSVFDLIYTRKMKDLTG